MQIIGDRHYKSDPGEQITFTLGNTAQTGVITVASSSGAGPMLPVTVTGSGHRTVAITAGFIANDGGSADILVIGSAGGADTSKIRQLTGLPFRTGMFIVD
jgi:hypothetical protein